jgi:hypothetical protein
MFIHASDITFRCDNCLFDLGSEPAEKLIHLLMFWGMDNASREMQAMQRLH